MNNVERSKTNKHSKYTENCRSALRVTLVNHFLFESRGPSVLRFHTDKEDRRASEMNNVEARCVFRFHVSNYVKIVRLVAAGLPRE